MTPVQLMVPILVLDDLGDPGVLKEEDCTPLDSGGIPRGCVYLELFFDPAGHRRLPINDDELVDRALAIQP